MTEDRSISNLSGIEGLGLEAWNKFNRVLSEDEKRSILRDRAKMLAQSEEEHAVDASDQLYLFEFVLNDEHFAFDTKFVREVLSARTSVAAIPCTPKFVAGVLNVRGEIITVLNTRLLFGIDSRKITALDKIIIVSDGNSQMGFLVDSVVGISETSKRSIQPPLSNVSSQQARFVAGITSQPLVVINVEALINDQSIVVDEEVD